MANIKSIIDAIPEAELTPTPDPVVPPEEVIDLPQATIEEVVGKLVRPWIYGEHLQRIAKQHNLSLKEMKAIDKALKARLKEIAKDKDKVAVPK